MKISVPNKEKQPNCFLFNDDEENRVYVEGNLKKILWWAWRNPEI